jgi:ATP-dependent Clp protease adaptor protein ClpS
MPEIQIVEKVEEVIQIELPKMYKVLLHNDDTTTFDFVIQVLSQIFHRSIHECIEIAQAIHLNGKGIAGSPYTREIAEEKSLETIRFARANGFPLTASFEEL